MKRYFENSMALIDRLFDRSRGIDSRHSRSLRLPLALLSALLLAQAMLAPRPALGASAAAKIDGFITFRLRLKYLQPSAITVTEGRYFIQVFNELVLGTIAVQVEDGKKVPLANAQINRAGGKHSEVMDLKPGNYTVRVVGKPAWSSTVTVTKK
jgi:hypothetical protein